MKKTIYNLGLHESITTDFGMVIMRVPSGWIYDCWNTDTDRPKRGTFVPFDNTFQVVKKEENGFD